MTKFILSSLFLASFLISTPLLADHHETAASEPSQKEEKCDCCETCKKECSKKEQKEGNCACKKGDSDEAKEKECKKCNKKEKQS